MKIVCGSCGAKYSIADEKVQGKVFKIRCRKCSHVIVVKGDADEEAHGADAQMSALGGSSAAPEWYVVIDGEQAGPLTPDDIESYFIQGRVNGESYAWRDGMPDWSALSSIDVFAHLFAGGGYEEDEATQIAQSPLLSNPPMASSMSHNFNDEPGDDATAVMDAEQFRAQPAQVAAAASFGQEPAGAGMDNMGGMSFGQEPAPSAGYGSSIDSGFGYGAGAGAGAGLATLESESGVDGDGMFAAFDSHDANAGLAYQSFAGLGNGNSDLDFGGIGSASAAPASNNAASNGAGNSANLIGQRNENSVLFSLSSLQKVEAVNANNTDAPTTEGSGLIDIQALASTHKQISTGRDNDFSAPTADNFSPGTLSMPAIMPKQGTHRNNKALIGLVAGGVLLLAGVGIAAIVVIGGKEDKPQVIVQKEIITREIVKDDTAGDNKAAAEAAAAEKAALAANTPPPSDTDEKPEDGSSDDKSSKSGKSSRGGKSSKRDDGGSKADEPKDDPAPRSTSSKKKGDGIDDLIKGLDKKDDPKPAAKEDPKPAASANLPEKLSKPQVQSTFRKYNGRVSDCAKNKNSKDLSGTLWVRLKIEPSGSVSSSDVDSKSASFKGSDVGNCITGVVKSMKFPETKSDLSFSYPISVK